MFHSEFRYVIKKKDLVSEEMEIVPQNLENIGTKVEIRGNLAATLEEAKREEEIEDMDYSHDEVTKTSKGVPKSMIYNNNL